ncbi:enoyl-CoA hydratase/isomerase family protein [Lysinibacillus odysseyi]|uniref:Enoyl-CoA hydratase n=1 Tax=Lysinibacillus odysseyi 34hs-1 = NBRC 100172 TaxID=1220589 RepID=A0A0A3IIR8_9BACI|nr:enoyl-CoA hydratase-related protein [Lysinibacillus odysseyi]KGR82713.1 hypothetical protein CD32_17825 [Lysinibacillus odysseyi 34hs-1 = NBRC 100172]
MNTKVNYSKQNNMAEITLNRPEALNALDNDMIASIIEALKDAGKDDAVRVVIIKGNGRAYCAGDDLVDMGTEAHPNPSDKVKEYYEGYPQIVFAMKELEKPIIVAVHKYALGAGFEIALAADFIISSEEAKFGLPFVLRGLASGTYLLQQRIGYHRAAKYLYLGEMFDAQTAMQLGLLYEVTTTDELENKVKQLAERLALSATRSIGLMKKAMHASAGLDYEQAFKLQTLSTFASYHSEDHKEGIQAFVEKREPKFTGK